MSKTQAPVCRVGLVAVAVCVGRLRAVGVTVVGEGKLRVGDKTGLLVIVK